MNKRIMLKGRLKRLIPHSTGDETKLYFSNFFRAWHCVYFFVLWELEAWCSGVETNRPNQLLLGGQVGEGGRIALLGGKWERSICGGAPAAISGRGFGTKERCPSGAWGGQRGTDCMITLSVFLCLYRSPHSNRPSPEKEIKKIGRGQREIREPFLPTIHPAKKFPRKKVIFSLLLPS